MLTKNYDNVSSNNEEYDKICNGLKALSEILSIYSYIINVVIHCNACYIDFRKIYIHV